MNENKEADAHNQAVNQVKWTLDQAYKLAVDMRGIKDWTNDFKTEDERNSARRDVEKYQLDIAEFIRNALFDIRSMENREKFDERMDKQDEKWAKQDEEWDKKHGTGDKKDWGTGPDDKPKTDDIGKV